MKKILSIILSLLMISSAFTGLGITANASEISSDEVSVNVAGFIYEVNDYGEAVLQGYDGEDVDVIIPVVIGGYTVTEIASGAFAGNDDIASVEIPCTIREIGNGAFANCENLYGVRIDNRAEIRIIKQSTFENCRNLREVVLPDKLEVIEDRAFFACESLESIVIPETTIYIALDAFDCVYHDFAVYGYTGTYVQDYANEKGFRFVPIGGSEYETMYEYEYYNDGIRINRYYGVETYLEIPEQIDGQNVVAIGDYAFAHNNAITEVVIPVTVTSIGVGAFRDCYNLECVNSDEMDNSNVEIISDYAFYGCESLCRVLGRLQYIREIGNYAFENCWNLEWFHIGEYIERIGDYAFNACHRMRYIIFDGEPEDYREIEISDNVFWERSCNFYILGVRDSYIHHYALEHNINFVGLDEYVDFETGFVYRMDYNDYEGVIITGYIGTDMEFTTELIIPETIAGYDGYYNYEVVAIADMAFMDNEIIRSVVIPDTVTELGRDAFASCNNLERVKLPNNLSVIPENAFIGCYSLTEIVIPDSVTEIGAFAFYMCENLTEINIPEGLRTIGDYALCDCSLSSVTIPKETTIGYSAFNGNYSEFIMYVHYASPAEEFAKQNCIRYRIVGAEDFELSFLPEAGCVYINYYDGSDSDVVIPDEVGDLYMRGIYDGAFRGIQTINSVYIPSKVEFISSNVFYGCTGLTEVVLPERLDWIGVEAFANCTNLKSITIPRETTIGENAFFGVSPEFIMYGYTNSPAQAYAEENNITFVCLDAPEFTYEINDYNEITITGYTGTDTDIVIPDMIDDCMVTTIGERAFFDMDITSVELPETLTEIHMNAFEHCDELTEINIPVRVRYIDSEAFRDCISLREFTVDIDNEYYSSVDGVLYDKKLTTVIRCPMALDREKLDLAPTTKTIADRAFDMCFNLYEINLSDSLEKIGSYAFNGCYSLTELKIPGSITEIGESAFTGCGLTTITLLNGISKIPDNAFDGCNKLESIVIPDSVTAIGELAFLNCTNLKTIVIPESVTEIELLAFQGCDSLTSVKLPDGLQMLGDCAFYSCDNLTSITIPESITTIGNQLFGLCNSLTSVTLHDGIQSIGWRAFRDCTSLTEIVIPRETTIDDTAFEGANPELVMYGYTNSPAQAFAKENSITFVALDVVKGDMSGDGVVDINDVTDIQKLMISDEELTEEQISLADVDGDGIVCVRDATYIQKYLAGIVDTI